MNYIILAINETLLASLVSAGVSIIIGIISGLLTARKAKMNFYSSTVSKERVEWIKVSRDITSKLVAFCSAHTENSLSTENQFQFEELKTSLLLRLTPKEYVEEKQIYKETDGKLISILQNDYTFIRENRFEIRDIMTLICKNEWNRIKAEAGGNKNVEKLIEKYDRSVKKQNNRR